MASMKCNKSIFTSKSAATSISLKMIKMILMSSCDADLDSFCLCYTPSFLLSLSLDGLAPQANAAILQASACSDT
jgi:hypothetical protein